MLRELRPNKSYIPLFDPTSVPIRGMNSAVAPSALGPGEWSLLQNIRQSSRLIQVRGGTAELGTILANGTFRGFWQGTIDGTEVILCGVKSGSDTRVYVSTDGSSWATEITAASGKYGATRFTDNSKLLTFEKVRLTFKTNAEMVVIQNGTDAPRLYDRGAGTVAKIEAVEAVLGVLNAAVKVSFPTYLTVKDYNQTDGAFVNDDGAKMALANSGTSTTDNRLSWTIDTTVTSGTKSLAVFDTSVNFGASGDGIKQLILGVGTAYPELWDNVKVEIGTTAPAYHVLYDPTDTTYPRPAIVNVTSQGSKPYDLVVFDVRGPKGAALTISNANRLRLTWVGNAAPSVDQTAEIFLIAESGYIQGQTQFGIAYHNPGSRTSSPGMVLSNDHPVRIRDLGGSELMGVSLPHDERIYYKFEVPYQNTSEAARDAGVSILDVYRRDPGSEYFYFLSTVTLASYAGSWAFSSGTAGALLYYTASSSVVTSSATLPSAFNTCVPTGRGMGAANGRFFVGSTGRLFFSDYRQPFQFQPFARQENGEFIEDQGGMIPLETDTVMAIVPMATSVLGVDIVYVLTEKSLYATSGVLTSQLQQLGYIGPHGTLAPHSVQKYKNILYWVDNEMQVLRMRGGAVEPIARDRVEDNLKTVPGSRKEFLYGCCRDERYLLAFTPSGQTQNTKILVYDDRLDAWSMDDPPKDADGLVNWFDGTNKVHTLLLAGLDSTTLKCYKYDDSSTTQDLGSDIAVQLNSYEIHDSLWDHKFFIRRIGIHCDDSASGSFTNTRTYKPSGGTGVSTCSVDVSSGTAWKWDGDQAQPVGNGVSCQISMAASLKANTRIYSIIAERQERGLGRTTG